MTHKRREIFAITKYCCFFPCCVHAQSVIVESEAKFFAYFHFYWRVFIDRWRELNNIYWPHVTINVETHTSLCTYHLIKIVYERKICRVIGSCTFVYVYVFINVCPYTYIMTFCCKSHVREYEIRALHFPREVVKNKLSRVFVFHVSKTIFMWENQMNFL